MRIFVALILLFSRTKATNTTDATCDLCISVVTGLENFITDDTTMDQIIAKVEEICHSLGMLEGLCIQVIEGFLPDIIQGILENQLRPDQICQQIGLCHEESTVEPTTPPAPRNDCKIVSFCHIFLF